jgi:uncharacterized membrane protein YkgB
VNLSDFDQLSRQFDRIDSRIAGWMRQYGHMLLRFSLGIIFIWFGILKPFGMSPAADLVRHTVYWVDPDWFVVFLGWWEVAIGVGLLYRPLIRGAIFLLFLQMPGTFLPLILLPGVCFQSIPFGLTMEGQYIVKNLILISAALVVGGTVRPQEGGLTKGSNHSKED